MVNKFPQVYHEGALASNNPYQNRVYSIYTEQNEAAYANDSAIDTFTFHDVSGNFDSPQTSYSLVVIKNTGEANSLLDLSTVNIQSPIGLSGVNQPFSIITQYSDIGSTGTTNLHTVQNLPASIVLNDGTGGSTTLNYGTGGTNFAALSPAPIGYVKLQTTSGQIENLNDGVENITGDDFGPSAVRYIPFYNPADISTIGNAITVTNKNYGTGALDYPHYACILIKCDPAIPLEITPGQVQLHVEQNGGLQSIVIDLIMQSYNVGDLNYTQGFLYKHGLDSVANTNYDPEQGQQQDTGDWSFIKHPYYHPIVPNGGVVGGTQNTPLIPGNSNSPYPDSGNDEVPPFDSSTALTRHLFIPPKPKSLAWNNYNFFLANNAGLTGTNNTYTDKQHCIRVYDETSYSGGVQFYLPPTSEVSMYMGRVNGNDAYYNVGGTTNFVMAGSDRLTSEQVDFGSWLPASDVINAGIENARIPFTPSANTNTSLGVDLGSLQTLSPGQYLYFVFDLNDGLQNRYTDFLTHRDYAGQATFPNAIDQAGNFAFRWNVTTFPFFWKNYYVNDTLNAATNKISFSSVSASYNNLGATQKTIYRFGKAWQTNALGEFDAGQSGVLYSNFGEHSHAFDDTSFAPRKARTHADQNGKYPALHSYHRGVSYGAVSYMGVIVDSSESGSPYQRSFINNVSSLPGGWTLALKHISLRELLMLPEIQMNSTDEYESGAQPTIAWTVLFDGIYTTTTPNTTSHKPMCGFFPWTNTTSSWNADYTDYIDGSNTITGEATRPITKSNLDNYDCIPNDDNLKSFIPDGYRVATANGDEASLVLGYSAQPDGTDGDKQYSTDVFSNINTFENITIGTYPNQKQKVIKLCTKLLPQSMNQMHTAMQINFPTSQELITNPDLTQGSSESIPQEDMIAMTYMTDSSKSGDAIGRFQSTTRFRLNEHAMLDYGKTTNDQNGGNLNSDITNASNTGQLEFTMWGYQWPKATAGFTALVQLGGTQTNISAGMPGLASKTLYLTEWGRTGSTVSGATAWTNGQEVTESMVETLSQSNTVYSNALPAGTVHSQASFYEFKIASRSRPDHGYWKRLPFNGRTVFKHQKYFSHSYWTAQNISLSTGQNANDAYGVLPGPRIPGRIDQNKNWRKAWTQDNYIYEGDTTYNVNTNMHECFIPINVGINGDENDYSIQLININLESETLAAAGTANKPTTRQLAFGNPLYRWDRVNGQNLRESGAGVNDELHNQVYDGTSVVNMTLHQCPIADVNVNPQKDESNELHPVVRTAPLSEITLHNITLMNTTPGIQSMLGGQIKTLKDGAVVTNTISTATNYTLASSGIQIGQTVHEVNPTTGAIITTNIPSGTTIIDIQANEIHLSNNAVNSTPVNNVSLRFQFPQPNYAQWAVTRGKRGGAAGSTEQTNPLLSLPRSNPHYYKYCELFVAPYNYANTPNQWYNNKTWDHTIDQGQVGAIAFLRPGQITKAIPGTHINNTVTDMDGNQFRYRTGTLWHSWQISSPTYQDLDTGELTYYGSGGSARFPGFMQNVEYSNFEVPNTGYGSPVGVPTRTQAGAPFIYLGIDHTKALQNKLEEGVFYNQLRIRYILNNKLDMFGLDHETIGGQYFNTGDSSDDIQRFNLGGGHDVHVYEDTFLVKINYDASVATLVVHDLEGDSVDTGEAINFGTLNSN